MQFVCLNYKDNLKSKRTPKLICKLIKAPNDMKNNK